MRLGVIAAAVCMTVAGLSVAAGVHASIKKATNIPAQPLALALQSLAKDCNFQIVYVSEEIGDRLTPGVVGEYTPEEALKQLLSGTGLTYKYLDERTVTIVPRSQPPSVKPLPPAPRATTDVNNSIRQERQSVSFWSQHRLAQAATAQAGVAQSDSQAAQDSRADSAGNPSELQEIIVTAQKRAENLQEVPISTVVLGSNFIQDQNVNSLADLNLKVPELRVANSNGASEIYIRGVGSGQNPSLDNAVGIFIDDIYHGRSKFTNESLLDVDRIEVLKGPQGTFFGNSAIAGAISVVTKVPGETFDAYSRALIAPGGNSGNSYALEGAAGGPVTDKFAVRVAASTNGMQGWMKDISTGQLVPDLHNEAGRITLQFKPTEKLDIVWKNEATNREELGTFWYQVDNCPPPAPFVASGNCSAFLARSTQLPTGLNNNNYSQPLGDGSWMKTYESMLRMEYKVGESTLTSVSGYTGYKFTQDLALVPFPDNQNNTQYKEKYQQYSEELRLVSPAGKPLEYLLGGYFQHDDYRNGYDGSGNTTFTLAPAAGAAQPSLIPYLPVAATGGFTQGERSYAAFGSATWNFADKWQAGVGLRWSSTYKDFTREMYYGTATQSYGGIVALPSSLQNAAAAFYGVLHNVPFLERTDDAWMPSAKIQYQISPQAMTYVSYNRGFLPGGFNGMDLSGIPARIMFGPEYVDAYEAGLKSELFDRQVRLNIAAFWSVYRDLQVQAFSYNPAIVGGVGGANFVQNAASSRSRGLEYEAEWKINPLLQISASGAYLDSVYLRYPLAGQTQLLRIQNILTQDLSGAPTPFAPKFAGNITGTLSAPVANGYRFFAEVIGDYSSGYYLGTFNNDPLHYVRSWFTLGSRLTLATEDGRWAVDLMGNNLTNAIIPVLEANMPSSPGSIYVQKNQPINFALQVRYRFRP